MGVFLDFASAVVPIYNVFMNKRRKVALRKRRKRQGKEVSLRHR
jgi:hypothetical protein